MRIYKKTMLAALKNQPLSTSGLIEDRRGAFCAVGAIGKELGRDSAVAFFALALDAPGKTGKFFACLSVAYEEPILLKDRVRAARAFINKNLKKPGSYVTVPNL